MHQLRILQILRGSRPGAERDLRNSATSNRQNDDLSFIGDFINRTSESRCAASSAQRLQISHQVVDVLVGVLAELVDVRVDRGVDRVVHAGWPAMSDRCRCASRRATVNSSR